MVFSGGRGAWDCVCEQARSICNAVVEGRRWDSRVFYEDVAAAAGLAGGLIEITAVILMQAVLPQPVKGLLLLYVLSALKSLISRFFRTSIYTTLYNSVIRVASCGLPAKYLAVAFINEVRIGVVAILLLSLGMIIEPIARNNFVAGLVSLILVFIFANFISKLLFGLYLPTFHCLKFADVEVVKEKCGERGVKEAFSYPFISAWGFIADPPWLTKCCREARVWLYRNVPEARRAALIYDATLNGLRAVAVAYALYVALRG